MPSSGTIVRTLRSQLKMMVSVFVDAANAFAAELTDTVKLALVPLKVTAVAPVNPVGLAEIDHLFDPAQQLGVIGAAVVVKVHKVSCGSLARVPSS